MIDFLNPRIIDVEKIAKRESEIGIAPNGIDIIENMQMIAQKSEIVIRSLVLIFNLIAPDLNYKIIIIQKNKNVN